MSFENRPVTRYPLEHTPYSIHTVGAPLAGHISDRLVTQWRKRRAGEWVPEDRLRGTLFGAGILVPVSVLCSGIITHYVEGNVGLTLNLVCLFFNGLGVGYLLFDLDQ